MPTNREKLSQLIKSKNLRGIIQLLQDSPELINEEYENNKTPLYEALFEDDKTIIIQLINTPGVDVNKGNGYYSPLDITTDIEIIKLLIQKGAKQLNSSLIDRAVRSHDRQLIDFCIDTLNAAVNAPAKNGLNLTPIQNLVYENFENNLTIWPYEYNQEVTEEVTALLSKISQTLSTVQYLITKRANFCEINLDMYRIPKKNQLVLLQSIYNSLNKTANAGEVIQVLNTLIDTHNQCLRHNDHFYSYSGLIKFILQFYIRNNLIKNENFTNNIKQFLADNPISDFNPLENSVHQQHNQNHGPKTGYGDEQDRRQADEQQHGEVDQQTPRNELNRPLSSTHISMIVLGGFIAAAGIAAVAIAFTVLNAATFGVAGVVVGVIGAATALSGVGLFATGIYKNRQAISDESLNFSDPVAHHNL